MEPVRIRACAAADIDGVITLERQWEQEEIAYGDFNPMSREDYLAILERFPAYFMCDQTSGTETLGVRCWNGSLRLHSKRASSASPSGR